MDVETCRDMVQHPFCSPGTTESLVSGALSKFKGRLLSEEDSTILERVLQILKETNESINIYDVSKMADKFRAMKRGIRNTPVVIINGEKYEGSEAILKALSTRK
jgi:hypothetical protein